MCLLLPQPLADFWTTAIKKELCNKPINVSIILDDLK